MEYDKGTEKIATGKFFTSSGNAKEDSEVYFIRRADTMHEHSEESPRKMRHNPFEKTADTFKTNKLIRNTAICAVAALVIWGIASSSTPEGQRASEAIKDVISYDLNVEEDLGSLKFVDGTLEEGATLVSADAQAAAETEIQAEQFVYPLDGIVTTTFAENGSGTIITATDTTEVKSSKAGEVSEVAENYLSVLNQDSTITTYYGVSANVQKGDAVEAGQVIGQLLSDVLYIEQEFDGAKTDPLA